MALPKEDFPIHVESRCLLSHMSECETVKTVESPLLR